MSEYNLTHKPERKIYPDSINGIMRYILASRVLGKCPADTKFMKYIFDAVQKQVERDDDSMACEWMHKDILATLHRIGDTTPAATEEKP